MIRSILIANRGEIAVRVARTCRELGIRSVAVYPDSDADALHVALADDAVALGGDPRAYLDIDAVITAARTAGADAIHPGYGFLSENAALATACELAGITFIGPSAQVIETMGSKISAKAVAVAAGVPVVPGRAEPGLTDADILAAVQQIGVPVLLKASAGGGGKGMRVVNDLAEVPAAVASARREALSAFGDDSLMVERFVASPRHLEVQILGDAHGNVRAVADRECSLQRRHQKVIEEAPVTSVPALREAMADDAVRIAKAVGYQGAGTVEFIADGDSYYFLEMNTRLQVEHPVTEAVTGLDLVALQIAIADGASIADLQVATQGVAVEARVYAEDPANGFLPTGGRLLHVAMPEGVRVDSGVRQGGEVTSHYDPMLAKIIAHGPDRAAACRALAAALQRTSILGVTTNVGYLAALLGDPAVASNEVHTRWIDEQPHLAAAQAPPEACLMAAALDRWLPDAADGWTDPWSVRSGWRMGPHAWAGWRFRAAEATYDVEVRGPSLQVRIDGGEPRRVTARRDGSAVVIAGEAGTSAVHVARDGERVWLGLRGRTWHLAELSRLAADRADESSAELAPVRSPMPGTVIAVAVSAGDEAAAGDALVTVEAMKMEHTLRAAAPGVVDAVLVSVGDRVALDQELLRWGSADA